MGFFPKSAFSLLSHGYCTNFKPPPNPLMKPWDNGVDDPPRQRITTLTPLNRQQVVVVFWGPSSVIWAEEGEVPHFRTAKPLAEEVEVVGFWGSQGGQEDGLGEMVVCSLFVSEWCALKSGVANALKGRGSITVPGIANTSDMATHAL